MIAGRLSKSNINTVLDGERREAAAEAAADGGRTAG